MLLDKFLPEFDLKTYYESTMAPPPQKVYPLVRGLDWSDSLLVRWLFKLRSLGFPEFQPTLDGMQRVGFLILGEEPGREIALGLVGRFWRLSPDVQRMAPSDFAAFSRPGYAKVAMNFLVLPGPGGGSLVSTETRVQCLGLEARRKFRIYWTLIGPFSGLIRKEALRLINKRALV